MLFVPDIIFLGPALGSLAEMTISWDALVSGVCSCGLVLFRCTAHLTSLMTSKPVTGHHLDHGAENDSGKRADSDSSYKCGWWHVDCGFKLNPYLEIVYLFCQ
jgi:hypothetical protein